MNTKEFGESQYLTVGFIKGSATKIGVILDEGVREIDAKYGKAKITLKVSMDEIVKLFNPSKENVQNLQKLGMDSIAWRGKQVQFSIKVVDGQDRIVAEPIMDKSTAQPKETPICNI